MPGHHAGRRSDAAGGGAGFPAGAPGRNLGITPPSCSDRDAVAAAGGGEGEEAVLASVALEGEAVAIDQVFGPRFAGGVGVFGAAVAGEQAVVAGVRLSAAG